MKNKKKRNYRALMYLGISIIAIGVVLNRYGRFDTTGIIVMAIGALTVMVSFEHKDNWRNPEE